MIKYQPHHGARLGASWSDLTSGLTSGVAKDIVREAEGPARELIRQERHNFVSAIIDGLPWFGLGTMIAIGTRYFVPDDTKLGKGIGYLSAAAAGTAGAWITASAIKGSQSEPSPAAAAAPASGTVNTIAQNTAKAIVAEAEPKIRKIVDEERARIAASGQAGLPLAVGSIAAFLSTWLLVDENNKTMKAIGYTGTALLMGAGIWIALEKEREAA